MNYMVNLVYTTKRVFSPTAKGLAALKGSPHPHFAIRYVVYKITGA